MAEGAVGGGRRELGFWRGHSGFREPGHAAAQSSQEFSQAASRQLEAIRPEQERGSGSCQALSLGTGTWEGGRILPSAWKDETLLPGQLLRGMPEPQPAWPLGSPGAVTALGSI